MKAASILSLPLPLMVLLWGTLTFPRPPKAFWISLIVYTQVFVLIKCFFQFDSWFWNSQIIPSNRPLSLTRLLGIEKNSSYATYDLVLLLALYCHRSILKSRGMWTSEASKDTKVPSKVFNEATGTNEAINIELVIGNEEKIEKSPEELEKSVDTTDLTSGDRKTENLSNFVIKAKHSVLNFFQQLFNRDMRHKADVYVYQFLCDFVNFFVILFGFSAFGKYESDGGVFKYLAENKVPMTFLVLLLIQFFLIVIDRALYLRKSLVGKIIFQVFLSIGLHAYMFFVLPSITQRRFIARWPPVVYYVIKCIYLLLSAYQIRCGYPTRIQGHFLTTGFKLTNSTGFRIFMKIPFLMELRTLMDWLWTDSSMTLDDWLKLEDIFRRIYLSKCERELEGDLPAPRGHKKGPKSKYLKAGTMILVIIIVIWFPIALFAFSSSIAKPNTPDSVSVIFEIGRHEADANVKNIIKLNSTDWDTFLELYSRDESALSFLTSYEREDVVAVTLNSNSMTWDASAIDKENLLDELREGQTTAISFGYAIYRKQPSPDVSGKAEIEKRIRIRGSEEIGLQLIKALEDPSESVTIPYLFPKFLKVKNDDSLFPARELTDGAKRDQDEINFQNLTMRLSEDGTWTVQESCNENFPEGFLYDDCDKHITMYLFCDRIFPNAISSLAAGGIVGLYLTMVYFFSKDLREDEFSGVSTEIIYDDMPSVDRVLQLCLDIYLVREFHEFDLEEDLFAKLIFLYRSPETIIKWTQPKRTREERVMN